MKSFRWIVQSAITIQMIVGGCATIHATSVSNEKITALSSLKKIVKTNYGSFKVPKGWVKNKEHSTKSKLFFVPDTYDGQGIPNNISVEYGNNHYTKKESADFAHAILRQLNAQMKEHIDGSITSSGMKTKQGETVLVFRIPLEDRVATQYYIVGNHCYAMIYETNMDGSAECDEATKAIVDSFHWKK